MNDKAKHLLNSIIKKKQIIGKNTNCDYFPCHDELEDCTFCYCPFYPCNEIDTGGFMKVSSINKKTIWACSSCEFIHKKKNTIKILEALANLNSEIQLIPKEKLKKIRKNIISQKGDSF